MAEKVELIYIGGDFYWESKTIMSCIYKENGERFDWGKLEMELRAGKEVHLRPATEKELEYFKKCLKAIQESQEG